MAVDAFDRWPLDVGNATAQDAPESLEIPLAFVPPFARKLGALASENGFAQAVTEVLADANITVEYNGDLFDGSFSADKEQGLIIASDHSHHLEPLLVQAAMSISGRNASNVMAMPISLSGRIMQGTEQGRELVIPIIPTNWAAEKRIPLNKPRNILRRSLHPSVLNRPKADLECINSRATAQAAAVIARGETVAIFPTGKSISNSNISWRTGIGHIVNKLPEEARDTTGLAVFQADLSAKHVLASLLLRDMGIRPRKQTVVLNANLLGSVSEICNPHIDKGPQAITDAVRDAAYARLTN